MEYEPPTRPRRIGRSRSVREALEPYLTADRGRPLREALDQRPRAAARDGPRGRGRSPAPSVSGVVAASAPAAAATKWSRPGSTRRSRRTARRTSSGRGRRRRWTPSCSRTSSGSGPAARRRPPRPVRGRRRSRAPRPASGRGRVERSPQPGGRDGAGVLDDDEGAPSRRRLAAAVPRARAAQATPASISDGFVKCDQVFTRPAPWLGQRLGRLNPAAMARVDASLRFVLGL